MAGADRKSANKQTELAALNPETQKLKTEKFITVPDGKTKM